MNIAAIIVGIDGWQQYTLPLIRSIEQHEPRCHISLIDNESKEPYRLEEDHISCMLRRTNRLCYSAAINAGKSQWDADWYIVLSNDVLCMGPFAHILAEYEGDDLVGPLLKSAHGFPYLEGWMVCIPERVWDSVGGWDEAYLGSDYEDVDYSTCAREHGFGLVEDRRLPFVHLDQRQRYYIVDDFAGKNAHNQNYFMQKHARVTA